MTLKNCSGCGKQPKIQSDELGIIYRFICEDCNKYTADVINKSSSLKNSRPDNETTSRLTEMWNKLN